MTELSARLAGNGQCYVCGEQQHRAHLGCISRYGLNQDVQSALAEASQRIEALQVDVERLKAERDEAREIAELLVEVRAEAAPPEPLRDGKT